VLPAATTQCSNRDGKFFQQRHQIGRDGNNTNILETEVQYVIGSGNHACSYLHRNAEGKVVELPVNWYSEKGGYWAVSPGYDRPNPSDSRRVISYECFSCHNAYPARAIAEVDDLVLGDALPEGIDCERCHGPGRGHIAASSSHAQPESIRRAIVNPVRLNRQRQLEVRMQCHLQTTAIRSPDSLRRYDRLPFPYQPGQPLGSFAIFFDFLAESDRFEIDHAAYRLSQSVCFRNSQMTCTTCHDPHQPNPQQAALEADAMAHYQAVCPSCHIAAHGNSPQAAFADCLNCHMPKRRTQDAGQFQPELSVPLTREIQGRLKCAAWAQPSVSPRCRSFAERCSNREGRIPPESSPRRAGSRASSDATWNTLWNRWSAITGNLP
jgi:hypothetical protein